MNELFDVANATVELRDIRKFAGKRERGAITLPMSASVAAAAALMDDEKIHAVIIVDATGRIVGIYTSADQSKVVRNASAETARVDRYMTKDPKTCTNETPLAHVAQWMNIGNFSHVPVVDSERRPVGMLSTTDFFRHCANLAKASAAVGKEFDGRGHPIDTAAG